MGSVTVGSANVMKAGMVKLVSIQLPATLHGRKAMKCARILKISSVLVQVRYLFFAFDGLIFSLCYLESNCNLFSN